MSRRFGKSGAADIMKESALNAGKTVAVVTANSMTLQRRNGTTTVIEKPSCKKPDLLIVYDDYGYLVPEITDSVR